MTRKPGDLPPLVVRIRPGPACDAWHPRSPEGEGSSVTTLMSFKEEELQSLIIVAAVAAADLSAPSASSDAGGDIVVTASREPIATEDAPFSTTVFNREDLDALALPLTSDVLRLAPGTSVAASGPRGSQTQVRIRGAEANHTLLFVDGIRFNDPAADNEARFDLLTNDALSRIEILRGPQSALWGAEALGGVVAVETASPLGNPGLSLTGEYGSLDTSRASGQFATRTGNLGVSGSAGWIRSDGIDAFGSAGERDGFDNLSGSLKAVFQPSAIAQIGLVGHYVEGESEFDGYDASFRRADTLDSTDNRIAAIRGWASLTPSDGWDLTFDGSLLDSANRNRLDGALRDSTSGRRFTLGGQISRKWGDHRFTAAVEHENEEFRARGGVEQDRSRELTAYVAEWRADWSPSLITDVALRHDSFSAFENATTFRASLLFRPAPGWTVQGSYGEGIAQPTFYNLYGFFPNFFIGNPDLGPEQSEGWEAGVQWSGDRASVGVTAFSNRLTDEIIDVYDPDTFLSSVENANGKSRRRGIEAQAQYRFGAAADLTVNYTYLDAQQQQVAGNDLVREVRRPRHSANAILAGSSGPFSWGAGIAYVGKRRDTNFDVSPPRLVILNDYVLASLNLAYQLNEQIEAYGRIENGFDAEYEDAVGYKTAGRTVYAGLRLRLGR